MRKAIVPLNKIVSRMLMWLVVFLLWHCVTVSTSVAQKEDGAKIEEVPRTEDSLLHLDASRKVIKTSFDFPLELFWDALNRAEREIDASFHSRSLSSGQKNRLGDVVGHYEALLEAFRTTIVPIAGSVDITRRLHAIGSSLNQLATAFTIYQHHDYHTHTIYRPTASSQTLSPNTSNAAEQQNTEKYNLPLPSLKTKGSVSEEAKNKSKHENTFGSIWGYFYGSLLTRMLSETDSFLFYDYYNLNFVPAVFHWPLSMEGQYLWFLTKDDNWDKFWRNATVTGTKFVLDQVQSSIFPHILPDVPIRVERSQHVYHLLVLYYSADFSSLNSDSPFGAIRQVIDFGGGSGDMPICFREMGYGGLYVVLDLAPMLLMQQYFHRLSGWPSYFISDSIINFNRALDSSSSSSSNHNNSSSEANCSGTSNNDSRGRTIAEDLFSQQRLNKNIFPNSRRTLLSTVDAFDTLVEDVLEVSNINKNSRVDSASAEPNLGIKLDNINDIYSTLFLATWSLTEAGRDVRLEVLDHVMKYGPGVIFLAMGHNFDGTDNQEWGVNVLLPLFVEHDYSFCWFAQNNRFTFLGGNAINFYIIANKVTKERPFTYCDQRAGCSRDVLYYGRSCQERF